MSYQDIGFDENLNRVEDSVGSFSDFSSADVDSYLDEVSGSKISGGMLSSPDGKIQVDLDKGVIKVNNGVADLVSLGVLDDGTIGLLIRDQNGNILMQVTQDKMFIQGPNKHLKINAIGEQIIIRDESDIVNTVLGNLTLQEE